jgi:hypothetical protein
VSCDPTASSGSAPGSTVTGPIRSPGWRSGGNSRTGIPAFFITSTAQDRVDSSSSAVVDAFVISAPADPVSQYASRSGISSNVEADVSAGVPAEAASW